MARVYYNKLIRDAVTERIQKRGGSFAVRRIEDSDEFIQELQKKVVEEALAVSKSRSRAEFLKEYADLSVVLDTLLTELQISKADIGVARAQNEFEKGLFERRLFLHWADDDEYVSNETPQGISK